MPKIDIHVDSVKSIGSSIKSLSSKLANTGVQISLLRNAIDSEIANRRGIRSRINQSVQSINEIENKLTELSRFIDFSMDQYVKADRKANLLTLPEKKSAWDKMKDGFGSFLDGAKGFGKGLWDAVVSTAEGLWNAVTHPIETAKGVVHVISHPIETAKSVWDSIKKSWNEDIINGDADSRGHWFGRAFGEIALAVVGTKGADKAVKLIKGSKVVEVPGGVKIVEGSKTGGDKGLNRLEYLHNKYGRFTTEELHNRINLREAVAREVERLDQSGLSKREIGPAVAGTLDKTTGKYYFGINNTSGDLPPILHPIIESRLLHMPTNVKDGYQFTYGAGSHAEVYSLNQALLANPNAKMDDLITHVVRSGKKLKPAGMMMPRCPHCVFITEGFEFSSEVTKRGK